VTAPATPALSTDDRRLLSMFTGDWSTICWDPQALDWTVGHPMFSIDTLLLRRMDILLLDGLLDLIEEPGLPLWRVALTDRGREALR
jgi:hypothetical protein